jgi:hypothetical protein
LISTWEPIPARARSCARPIAASAVSIEIRTPGEVIAITGLWPTIRESAARPTVGHHAPAAVGWPVRGRSAAAEGRRSTHGFAAAGFASLAAPSATAAAGKSAAAFTTSTGREPRLRTND